MERPHLGGQGRSGPTTRRQAQRSAALRFDLFVGTGVPPPMSFLSVRELARCELVSREFRRMATAPDALREARLSFITRYDDESDDEDYLNYMTEEEAEEEAGRRQDVRRGEIVARSEAELKYLARRLTPE